MPSISSNKKLLWRSNISVRKKKTDVSGSLVSLLFPRSRIKPKLKEFFCSQLLFFAINYIFFPKKPSFSLCLLSC